MLRHLTAALRRHRSTSADLSGRRREAAVRGIERLLDDTGDAAPHGRRRARPAVILACRPALDRIVAALRDESRTLPQSWTAQVDWFLTESARSPLYGSDPSAARAEAERLAAGA